MRSSKKRVWRCTGRGTRFKVWEASIFKEKEKTEAYTVGEREKQQSVLLGKSKEESMSRRTEGLKRTCLGFWLLAAKRHLLLLVASAPEVQGFIVQKDLLAKELLLSIWGLMALRQTLIESIKGDLELSTSIPASPYQLLAGCHNSWLPSSGIKCQFKIVPWNTTQKWHHIFQVNLPSSIKI